MHVLSYCEGLSRLTLLILGEEIPEVILPTPESLWSLLENTKFDKCFNQLSKDILNRSEKCRSKGGYMIHSPNQM